MDMTSSLCAAGPDGEEYEAIHEAAEERRPV